MIPVSIPNPRHLMNGNHVWRKMNHRFNQLSSISTDTSLHNGDGSPLNVLNRRPPGTDTSLHNGDGSQESQQQLRLDSTDTSLHNGDGSLGCCCSCSLSSTETSLQRRMRVGVKT